MIESLGHVVLRVRDLERSEAFYHELLGIPISTRAPDWGMTFFTLGEHHDLAISALGGAAKAADAGRVGLDHVAFRVKGGLDGLRAAKTRLEDAGLTVAAVDHVVTKSLYFEDPDGNRVEIYCNASEAWRDDPSVILSDSKGLEL